MLTAAEFIALRNVTGISAEWHQAKAPKATKTCRVILAPIDKRSETLVNSYGVNGVSIQVLASDVAPAKFDQFVVNGERYTIDTPVPYHERGTGALVYYVCFVKGK